MPSTRRWKPCPNGCGGWAGINVDQCRRCLKVDEGRLPSDEKQPLPPDLLQWRIYCLTCGRDRWLRATEATIRAWHQLAPCYACGGVQWVELDYGARDAPTQYRGNETGGDPLDGPRRVVRFGTTYVALTVRRERP